MAFGYKFDPLQTAIDRGIQRSIIKNGIDAGEFDRRNPPGSSLGSGHTPQNGLGAALVGVAMLAVGGFLMNWLTSTAQPPGDGKDDLHKE